jgi:hypothetical protein
LRVLYPIVPQLVGEVTSIAQRAEYISEPDSSIEPQTDSDYIMIDSGCTTHSFNKQQYFTSYSANNGENNHVEKADNAKLQIAGSGSISLDMRQPGDGPSVTMTIRHAIHVPDCQGIIFQSVLPPTAD